MKQPGRNLLITPSLIDAVTWAETAPNSPCRDNPSISWRQKAYNDIKRTLARIWDDTPSPILERGSKFENAVYSVVNAGTVDSGEYSQEFKWFLEKCKGGVFQKKTRAMMDVDGQSYCIYGKMDCRIYQPVDIIRDIKTTTDFKGASKYLGGAQHKLYCLSEALTRGEDHIPLFEYDVAEFPDETTLKIQATFSVPYTPPAFSVLKQEVEEMIRHTIKFIEMFPESGDLADLYVTKFCMF